MEFNGHHHQQYKVLTPFVSVHGSALLTVPWKYVSAMRPVTVTKIQVPGYEKHRCDPEYNLKFHQGVNGLINEFCRATLKMYNTFKNKKSTLNPTLHRQAKWAAVDLRMLQEGLAAYTTFAVDMLNTEYMIDHIGGCNDEELATFLSMISKCTVFHLSSRPLKVPNFKQDRNDLWEHAGYDIIVKFDDDNTAYKFGTAADLNE